MIRKQKLDRIRLIISAAVGLSVFIISCFAVWRMSPDTLMNNHYIEASTRSLIRDLNMRIAERMENGGTLPQSPRELTALAPHSERAGLKAVRHGVPVDYWGCPLFYSVHGTSYTLKSYGRDGKPGGSGFDRDLDASNTTQSLDFTNPATWANPPMPSLRQFLFELPSGGMVLSCVLSGYIAFLATLALVRPEKLAKSHVKGLALSIALTVLATVFFAAIIMQLHIPTGH